MMSSLSVFTNAFSRALPLIFLASCAAVGTQAQEGKTSSKAKIQLSNMALRFETPTLSPSKDFPPPRLLSKVDLNEVKDPELIFHGYWDGPRHKLISVTGTLRIWFELSRWPPELSSTKGCAGKANGYVEQQLAEEEVRYKSGLYKNRPHMERSDEVVAGRDSIRYVSSYDHGVVQHVIPLDNNFFLYLMFGSARNSDPSAGWDETSTSEQERFLKSIELSGVNDDDCS